MAPNVEQEEYQLLLKQRDQLIDAIMLMDRSFHTAVFSCLAVFLRYSPSCSTWKRR